MNRSLLAPFFAVTLGCWLALSACSPDTTGDACTQNDDCQTGQTCYTDFPDGYCTKGCTNAGTDKACGAGTVCSPSGERMLCALICKEQDDCRDGYECNGVPGTELKSCRPKA